MYRAMLSERPATCLTAHSISDRKSCLSPNVHHLICEVGITASEACTRALDSEGVLDWETIHHLLDPVSPEDENREYFVECVKRLSSIMRQVHELYEGLDLDTFTDKFKCYFEWTTDPQVLLRCFSLTRSDRHIGPLHAVLLMTPILERSLGDLYLLKNQPCPSLLRDLLLTPELREMIGPTQILLLRILLGPPISLNLRNIAWHGFLGPEEVHPQYSDMLLCVTASLGKTLVDRGITLHKHREAVTFPQIDKLEHKLLCGHWTPDYDHLAEIFENSTFINARMQPIWKRFFEEYQEKRYHDCVCMLLPQLENGLRMMFADVNNCPHRVLTAENNVLFTTFDEMMSPEVEDQTENKLRSRLGDSVMSLLLDILVYPAGPRLRDRISHGETNVSAVTAEVASLLLSVCVILSFWEQKDRHVVRSNPQIQMLLQRANDYESIFHPISLAKSMLMGCVQSLSKWRSLPQPSADELSREQNETWTEDHSIPCKQISKLAEVFLERYSEQVPSVLDIRLLEPFMDPTAEYKTKLEIRIATLFRNLSAKEKSKEEEIVTLLNQILHQCHLVSEQVMAVVTTRFVQFESKELRSRQRKTYTRMLDSIPYLSSGLRLVLMIVYIHLYTLDNAKSQSDKLQTQVVRVLKTLLKYCENLLTLTSSDKNRWEEAFDLTNKIVLQLENVMIAS